MKKGQYFRQQPLRVLGMVAIVVLAIVGTSCAGELNGYEQSARLGRKAAAAAIKLIKDKSGQQPETADLIVMTTAGYAELGRHSTMGALDGLSAVTGASRGRNTLVELHASFASPLWFAVYDKASGQCAYIEADSFAAADFKVRTVARIDVGHLRANAEQARAVFDGKPFGGNEFRIVTAANAIAAGAPACVVRSFEFHDHFCPGVSAGILMAAYLRGNFAPDERGYCVHSVDPWCKDDGLLVLLNATPGKRSYAATYPSAAEKAAWLNAEASTIVYRHHGGVWEGLVLAFEWGAAPYSKTGNTLIDYLSDDLWYLEQMRQPEKFVKVVKRFELPQGLTPMDWARPGFDPLKQLGLLSK